MYYTHPLVECLMSGTASEREFVLLASVKWEFCSGNIYSVFLARISPSPKERKNVYKRVFLIIPSYFDSTVHEIKNQPSAQKISRKFRRNSSWREGKQKLAMNFYLKHKPAVSASPQLVITIRFHNPEAARANLWTPSLLLAANQHKGPQSFIT